MARSCATIAIVLALSVVMSSCRPIEEIGGPAAEPVFATEVLPFKDAIPQSYGRLVGVIQSPLNDSRAILWFEQPNATIAAIWVDYTQGVGEKVLLIPRK